MGQDNTHAMTAVPGTWLRKGTPNLTCVTTMSFLLHLSISNVCDRFHVKKHGLITKAVWPACLQNQCDLPQKCSRQLALPCNPVDHLCPYQSNLASSAEGCVHPTPFACSMQSSWLLATVTYGIQRAVARSRTKQDLSLKAARRSYVNKPSQHKGLDGTSRVIDST